MWKESAVPAIPVLTRNTQEATVRANAAIEKRRGVRWRAAATGTKAGRGLKKTAMTGAREAMFLGGVSGTPRHQKSVLDSICERVRHSRESMH